MLDIEITGETEITQDYVRIRITGKTEITGQTEITQDYVRYRDDWRNRDNPRLC